MFDEVIIAGGFEFNIVLFNKCYLLSIPQIFERVVNLYGQKPKDDTTQERNVIYRFLDYNVEVVLTILLFFPTLNVYRCTITGFQVDFFMKFQDLRLPGN